MTHLFAPSIPAYKTPGSRRSFIARVAGRGFGYGFDAQSSRLFPTGARRGSRYQKLGRVHVNEVAKSKCRSRLRLRWPCDCPQAIRPRLRMATARFVDREGLGSLAERYRPRLKLRPCSSSARPWQISSGARSTTDQRPGTDCCKRSRHGHCDGPSDQLHRLVRPAVLLQSPC